MKKSLNWKIINPMPEQETPRLSHVQMEGVWGQEEADKIYRTRKIEQNNLARYQSDLARAVAEKIKLEKLIKSSEDLLLENEEREKEDEEEDTTHKKEKINEELIKIKQQIKGLGIDIKMLEDFILTTQKRMEEL